MSQFVTANVRNSPSSRPKNITSSRQLTATAPVYTPRALHSQRQASHFNNQLPIGRSFPNYPPPGFPVKNSPSRIASSYDRNVSGQSLLQVVRPKFQAPRSKSQSYLKDYRTRFVESTVKNPTYEFDPTVKLPPGIPIATKSQNPVYQQCTTINNQTCLRDQSVIDIASENDYFALYCWGQNSKCHKNNEKYHFSHRKCLEAWEKSLITIIKKTPGLSTGFSDKDRKSVLWLHFERWVENSEEFANKSRCPKCKLGYLRVDQHFDPKGYLSSTSMPQMVYATVNAGSNQSINLSPSGNRYGSWKDQNNNHLPESSKQREVFKKTRLPDCWRVKADTGETTGTLAEYNITESWLDDDFDENNIDSSYSEIEWLVAKSKHAKKALESVSQIQRGAPPSSSRQSPVLTEKSLIAIPHTDFPPRTDFSDYHSKVSSRQMNPYHIMMEMGGQSFSIDDMRAYILRNLSQSKTNELTCVLCDNVMKIYQHFPLMAGTMFLSHHGESKVQLQGQKGKTRNKLNVLHGVCLECLQGSNRTVLCDFCGGAWKGDVFRLGTLYMFDIFASRPCCSKRIECKVCGARTIEEEPKSFSEASNSYPCPSCGLNDFHLAKPFNTWKVKMDSPFQKFTESYLFSDYQPFLPKGMEKDL